VIIYKVHNKLNGKIYIGQTSSDIKQRVCEHLMIGGSPVFHKALKKYGIENFDASVIDTAENREELNEREKYWIKFYDCKAPNGYNLSDGGSGPTGYIWTEEQKKDHRKDLKGKTYEEIHGEEKARELKEKLSKQSKGKTYEEIHGEEKARELKLKRIGKTYEDLYGEEKAKQTKRKIGESSKRYRNGKTYEEMYGEEKAEQTKRKIGKSSKGRKKGKTYEEMYGNEKAEQLKSRKSEAVKGRHWKCKKIRKDDNRQGKNWEEIYGKEKAKEMRENLSRNRKGSKRGLYKQRTKEVRWIKN